MISPDALKFLEQKAGHLHLSHKAEGAVGDGCCAIVANGSNVRFAHLFETGGPRRVFVRGHPDHSSPDLVIW